MRFWFNAFVYATLMVSTLFGVLLLQGVLNLDLGEIEWSAVVALMTALSFGFKSAVEANIELMKRETDNVPTLTDRTSGTTE